MQNLNFVFGDVNSLIPSLSTHPAGRAWDWGYPGPTFILQGMNVWETGTWLQSEGLHEAVSLKKYMTPHNTLKYLVINKLWPWPLPEVVSYTGYGTAVEIPST